MEMDENDNLFHEDTGDTDDVSPYHISAPSAISPSHHHSSYRPVHASHGMHSNTSRAPLGTLPSHLSHASTGISSSHTSSGAPNGTNSSSTSSHAASHGDSNPSASSTASSSNPPPTAPIHPQSRSHGIQLPTVATNNVTIPKDRHGIPPDPPPHPPYSDVAHEPSRLHRHAPAPSNLTPRHPRTQTTESQTLTIPTTPQHLAPSQHSPTRSIARQAQPMRQPSFQGSHQQTQSRSTQAAGSRPQTYHVDTQTQLPTNRHYMMHHLGSLASSESTRSRQRHSSSQQFHFYLDNGKCSDNASPLKTIHQLHLITTQEIDYLRDYALTALETAHQTDDPISSAHSYLEVLQTSTDYPISSHRTWAVTALTHFFSHHLHGFSTTLAFPNELLNQHINGTQCDLLDWATHHTFCGFCYADNHTFDKCTVSRSPPEIRNLRKFHRRNLNNKRTHLFCFLCKATDHHWGICPHIQDGSTTSIRSANISPLSPAVDEYPQTQLPRRPPPTAASTQTSATHSRPSATDTQSPALLPPSNAHTAPLPNDPPPGFSAPQSSTTPLQTAQTLSKWLSRFHELMNLPQPDGVGLHRHCEHLITDIVKLPVTHWNDALYSLLVQSEPDFTTLTTTLKRYAQHTNSTLPHLTNLHIIVPELRDRQRDAEAALQREAQSQSEPPNSDLTLYNLFNRSPSPIRPPISNRSSRPNPPAMNHPASSSHPHQVPKSNHRGYAARQTELLRRHLHDPPTDPSEFKQWLQRHYPLPPTQNNSAYPEPLQINKLPPNFSFNAAPFTHPGPPYPPLSSPPTTIPCLPLLTISNDRAMVFRYSDTSKHDWAGPFREAKWTDTQNQPIKHLIVAPPQYKRRDFKMMKPNAEIDPSSPSHLSDHWKLDHNGRAITQYAEPCDPGRNEPHNIGPIKLHPLIQHILMNGRFLREQPGNSIDGMDRFGKSAADLMNQAAKRQYELKD